MEDENKKNKSKAEEPALLYKGKGSFMFFKSVEEQEEFSRKKSAALSPIECLQHMRLLINMAYGITGFDPEHIVHKHSITIRE